MAIPALRRPPRSGYISCGSDRSISLLCHSATAIVVCVFHDMDLFPLSLNLPFKSHKRVADDQDFAKYFLDRFFDRFRAGLKDPEQE